MTKSKIIQAAINNLSTHGYQGATMSKIAKDVNIKPASLYYFFQSKEDLFKEAIQVILNNHFSSMKSSFANHSKKNLSVLFSELFRSIVSHHTGNTSETKAYVTIVSSPIPNIKNKVSDYLLYYNDWLFQNLTEFIKERYPNLEDHKIKEVIDYFIFIGNGLFWGIVIYDQAGIEKNLKQSIYSMEQYISEILRS